MEALILLLVIAGLYVLFKGLTQESEQEREKAEMRKPAPPPPLPESGPDTPEYAESELARLRKELSLDSRKLAATYQAYLDEFKKSLEAKGCIFTPELETDALAIVADAFIQKGFLPPKSFSEKFTTFLRIPSFQILIFACQCRIETIEKKTVARSFTKSEPASGFFADRERTSRSELLRKTQWEPVKLGEGSVVVTNHALMFHAGSRTEKINFDDIVLATVEDKRLTIKKARSPDIPIYLMADPLVLKVLHDAIYARYSYPKHYKDQRLNHKKKPASQGARTSSKNLD